MGPWCKTCVSPFPSPQSIPLLVHHITPWNALHESLRYQPVRPQNPSPRSTSPVRVASRHSLISRGMVNLSQLHYASNAVLATRYMTGTLSQLQLSYAAFIVQGYSGRIDMCDLQSIPNSRQRHCLLLEPATSIYTSQVVVYISSVHHSRRTPCM